MSRRFLTPINVVRLASAPSSPTQGDVYYNTVDNDLYFYDGTSWVATGGGAGAVTVSDTAPSSPSNGDIWFNSVSTRTYVYYNDGNSSQWVEASSPVAAVGLLDGGSASSTYGGIASINAGSA